MDRGLKELRWWDAAPVRKSVSLAPGPGPPLWWGPRDDLRLANGSGGTYGPEGSSHPLSWTPEGVTRGEESGSSGGDGRREGDIPPVSLEPVFLLWRDESGPASSVHSPSVGRGQPGRQALESRSPEFKFWFYSSPAGSTGKTASRP